MDDAVGRDQGKSQMDTQDINMTCELKSDSPAIEHKKDVSQHPFVNKQLQNHLQILRIHLVMQVDHHVRLPLTEQRHSSMSLVDMDIDLS